MKAKTQVFYQEQVKNVKCNRGKTLIIKENQPHYKMEKTRNSTVNRDIPTQFDATFNRTASFESQELSGTKSSFPKKGVEMRRSGQGLSHL